MLISGSSVNTISTVPPSSAKQVSAPTVGMFQSAHKVLKVISTSSYPFSVNCGKYYGIVLLWPPSLNHGVYSAASCVFDCGKSRMKHLAIIGTTYWLLLQASTLVFQLEVHSLTLLIELKPWPNWHEHQGSLIVALVYPYSSIVMWVEFSCFVHKLLVWPLHCESWWKCCANFLQLLASAGQVDSINMGAIQLIQLHIAIPLREVYCLLFTYYHEPVEWKPPWVSLVYIISNRHYIAYSLRIRTPTVPHLFWWPMVAKLKFGDAQYKIFLGEVMGQCLYIRYVASQLLHIVLSPRLMSCIASTQYSQIIFRICMPEAIPLFSVNHTPVVFSYIEELHHDSVIPRIISPVSTMLGKRCYRQFWKPPWAFVVCKVITWTFLARVRNLQSSGTVVAMFLGLTGMKLMTDYEFATKLPLLEHMLIFSEMAILKFANQLCESSRISKLFQFQKITFAAWDDGDMQLSLGIYMGVTMYIFRKWIVTLNFDGKIILLCVSKMRKLLGVNQIDAMLILHWAEYTKNHIFLFGSKHMSMVTSYWSIKSRFQIILCMEYFCCSSLGLCHTQIRDHQEVGDKDSLCTQSALSHHSVIKHVEYTNARIFTCISKTVNCLLSVRFYFYNLMIEDP